MKTNIVSIVIVLSFAATCCYGQDVKDTATTSQTQNKTKTVKKVEIPAQPPQTFKPSEEVSADAVISFPTDI